jgi:hypothetical protein
MVGEMLGRLTFFVLFPFLMMAIIGGVYYLFARPRVTFRQAMFRWWVVLTSLGVLLLGILGQITQTT